MEARKSDQGWSGTRSARSKVLASAAILVFLFALLPSGAAGASLTGKVTAPSRSAISTTIRSFLAERAERLVSGKRSLGASPLQRTAALSRKANSAATELDARREQLKALHEEYTAARTTVVLGKTEFSGDVMTVAVTEETQLDYRKIHGDEPDYTAYTAEHVFTFERTPAGWALAGQRSLSSDGLAPVTEVSSTAAVSAPAADPSASSTARPAGPLRSGDKPRGSSAGPGSTSATGSAPLATDSSARPERAPALSVTPMAIPAGLNYQAMVDYAYAHWGGAGAPYNPNYRDFSANGGGGDCTNFISQSLRNGGWVFKTGFYQDNNNWWYGLVTQTYTWAGAQNWSIFAPQRTNRLGNVWDMRLADVLQLDFNRDGSKDHTMLMTKWTSTERYMTYHTTNTKNKSLSSIIAANPNTWFYAYGT